MGNKKIAKNTMMLYFRQILVLFVSLYTVRVVLEVLGVEDYGILNVVGGFVALFSFLKGTMESATQRYFSFALGEKSEDNLKKIFSINVIIYFIIGVLGVAILETVGLWFVQNRLNLPAVRIESAVFIYHLSIATFFINIISTPLVSMVLAHEDMHIYAYVSIFEVVMKLVTVILLQHLIGDKLELYATLLFIVYSLSTIIYAVISFVKYKECQFKHFFWDKNMFVNILGFTGWTLFGQITTVSRTQAMVILVNQMFSPIMVSAQAIATSISAQIAVFSNNFNKSLYPPIIKAYASDDRDNMFFLIYNGCNLTFFLMWLFAMPFIVEMEFVMKLWLTTLPANAILFTRLALINVIINSVSQPLTTAARAPGKMRNYELILGIIQLFIFFVSWIVLKLGAEAYSIYVVALGINLLMFIIRLYLVKNLIGLDVLFFTKKVVIPIFKVTIISLFFSFFIKMILPEGIIYSIIIILCSLVLICLSIYYFGLDYNLKNKVKDLISIRFSKFFKRI